MCFEFSSAATVGCPTCQSPGMLVYVWHKRSKLVVGERSTGWSYAACLLKNSAGIWVCFYSNRSFLRRPKNSILILIYSLGSYIAGFEFWASVSVRKLKKQFVVGMDHIVSRLFRVLLAVEGGGGSTLVLKSCSLCREKIWGCCTEDLEYVPSSDWSDPV